MEIQALSSLRPLSKNRENNLLKTNEIRSKDLVYTAPFLRLYIVGCVQNFQNGGSCESSSGRKMPIGLPLLLLSLLIV